MEAQAVAVVRAPSQEILLGASAVPELAAGWMWYDITFDNGIRSFGQ